MRLGCLANTPIPFPRRHSQTSDGHCFVFGDASEEQPLQHDPHRYILGAYRRGCLFLQGLVKDSGIAYPRRWTRGFDSEFGRLMLPSMGREGSCRGLDTLTRLQIRITDWRDGFLDLPSRGASIPHQHQSWAYGNCSNF